MRSRRDWTHVAQPRIVLTWSSSNILRSVWRLTPHTVPDESVDDAIYVQRHLRVGWWSFLLFATFGLVLESLQGFKIRAYLDVSNETRRLMWTLAHAHGVLIGVLHLCFAFTLRALDAESAGWPRTVSLCLRGATVLLDRYYPPGQEQ